MKGEADGEKPEDKADQLDWATACRGLDWMSAQDLIDAETLFDLLLGEVLLDFIFLSARKGAQCDGQKYFRRLDPGAVHLVDLLCFEISLRDIWPWKPCRYRELPSATSVRRRGFERAGAAPR